MENRSNSGQHVSESPFFKNFLSKAENYIKTPGRVTNMLNDAYKKASENKDISEIAGEVWDNLQRLFRMVKAAVGGEYHGIPNKTIIGAVAVLLYFLSPIDFVPDFIPVVGLLDDMSLVAWFLTSIKAELDNFEAWEAGNGGGSMQGNTAMSLQAGGKQGGSPVKDHGDQAHRTQTGSTASIGGSTGIGSSAGSSASGSPAGKSDSGSGSSTTGSTMSSSQGGTSSGATGTKTQGTDFPGSAGEMRKDVSGEAKDDSMKLQDHSTGLAGKSSGKDQTLEQAKSVASNTGNLGAADDSQGTGKNLGDSSRNRKTTDNPNKDGAHNR
jgi:uncharacterized membrane protein YkvA (DUF1232 family)